MPAAKRTSDSNLAARELGFLVRLAQAAASTQKPDELLALIIRETTTAMGTDVCSLYLLMPSGRELLLTATNGLNENMVGKVKMKVGEGITGFVAESRSPAVVADAPYERDDDNPNMPDTAPLRRVSRSIASTTSSV